MPLAQTLERVHEDIRSGDLGRARARLHGLIASYPDDLDLRAQLGEVYWGLQLPEMAGRYWYLVERKDERMLVACERFEETFHSDPLKILSALKFKGNFAAMQDTYAGHVLADLDDRARKKRPWYPRSRMQEALFRSRFPQAARQTKRGNFWVRLGCSAAIVLFVLLALIGLFTTITTALKWLH